MRRQQDLIVLSYQTLKNTKTFSAWTHQKCQLYTVWMDSMTHTQVNMNNNKVKMNNNSLLLKDPFIGWDFSREGQIRGQVKGKVCLLILFQLWWVVVLARGSVLGLRLPCTVLMRVESGGNYTIGELVVSLLWCWHKDWYWHFWLFVVILARGSLH